MRMMFRAINQKQRKRQHKSPHRSSSNKTHRMITKPLAIVWISHRIVTKIRNYSMVRSKQCLKV